SPPIFKVEQELVSAGICGDIGTVIRFKRSQRIWTKPELFRILRIRLKADPFGLQIKQGQPQGKRSGRRHAVVDEKQPPAHDPTGIDHDIIETYTLRASECFGREDPCGLYLAVRAD